MSPTRKIARVAEVRSSAVAPTPTNPNSSWTMSPDRAMPSAVIAIITQASIDSPRTRRRRNASMPPVAASRDSEGSRTTPSGTPMTPIGIWRIANAKLNTLIGPGGQGRGEAGHHEEHDLRHPEAEGARRHQHERATGLRVRQVDARPDPRPDPPQRRDLDQEMGGRPGDDADREPRDAERRDEEDRAADDPEVVRDRRQGRGAETAAGVERAGGDGAGGEEQRGEDHDPRQLGGQGELGRVEPRRDRRDEPGAQQQDDRGQDRAACRASGS